MAEHIRMHMEPSDEWPLGAGPGTFRISDHGLEGRPSVCGHIEFICPNAKHCAVFLGKQFEDRRTPDEPCVWAWNGDMERPTLTPSVNCIAEKDGKPTGGCGWHGHITNGEIA